MFSERKRLIGRVMGMSLARDIPAMAVGDRVGAEHSNQTHPSREWLSVAVSRVMLSRELREHTSSRDAKQISKFILHTLR